MLASLLFCGSALAQEPACTVEVPAVVALPNASLVQRLDANGFVAHDKGRELNIESVKTDRGPRRILFVVETGKRVPAAARKLEAAIISELVTNSRPEDSFALLTTRGPWEEMRFGIDKKSLLAAVRGIETGIKGKNQDAGVLDSIFEGIEWFRPSQPGDAIFALTMGTESSHQISYAKVRNALVRERVRVFGYQLGEVIGGYYSAGIGMGPGGQFVPTASIDPNLGNFFALSLNTGGFAAEENAEGDPQREYKLTDERLKVVRYVSLQEYKAIVEFYRMEISAPFQDLRIDLAGPIRKQLPQARVSYANGKGDCSGAVGMPSR